MSKKLSVESNIALKCICLYFPPHYSVMAYVLMVIRLVLWNWSELWSALFALSPWQVKVTCWIAIVPHDKTLLFSLNHVFKTLAGCNGRVSQLFPVSILLSQRCLLAVSQVSLQNVAVEMTIAVRRPRGNCRAARPCQDLLPLKRTKVMCIGFRGRMQRVERLSR